MIKRIFKALGNLIAIPVGLSIILFSACLIPIKLLNAALTGRLSEELARLSFAWSAIKFGTRSMWNGLDCSISKSITVSNSNGESDTYSSTYDFIVNDTKETK